MTSLFIIRGYLFIVILFCNLYPWCYIYISWWSMVQAEYIIYLWSTALWNMPVIWQVMQWYCVRAWLCYVKMETENNSDVVQLFNIRLSYYLTRIPRTCALIRKHKENLLTSGDFSFPVEWKYWLKYLEKCVKCKDSFITVPFTYNFAAENSKTILEYLYFNRVQVAEGETVCDGAEWVCQIMNLEPQECRNHWGNLWFLKNLTYISIIRGI